MGNRMRAAVAALGILAAVVTGRPAAAATDAGLAAVYYDNIDFTNPKLTLVDRIID